MSARTGLIVRVAGVALVAAGVGLIAQRLEALTTAVSNIASSLASTSSAMTDVPHPPSPAEAARLRALSDRIYVISQNLANAQTTGFKRRRVDISGNLKINAGDLPLDMTPGALENTGRDMDLAIMSDGFFHVRTYPSSSGRTGYTRNGNFFIAPNGELAVGIGAGYSLIPPVNIPLGVKNISVAMDGTISYTAAGGKFGVRAGQILVARFNNPQALSPLGGGVYAQTPASGPAVLCTPGQNGAGQVMAGFLESSNVDPIKESENLVEAGQSLQFSGQAFETAILARQSLADADRR